MLLQTTRKPGLLAVGALAALLLAPAVLESDTRHRQPSQPVKPAAANAQAAAPQASDSRMDWWREARFGLFIHWGLYAVPAGEWNGRTDYGEWIRHSGRIPIDIYDRFRARFNPSRFDPGAWVALAKRAGMKYIVITTKHHDGFALFDSKETDFDVMSTPFRRDVIKALADACRREGIRICWYYSIMDWHHPDYLPRRDWEDRPTTGADFERYVRYMKAQLKELVANYGDIGVLWFDGQWEGTWTNERGRDLYAYVRSLQPSIIVNNRVGRAGGDFGLSRDQGQIGDFGTPEQEIPATGVPGLDWETCMTMNQNWGYNRADKRFKTTEELIRALVDIASKGGNFLLNVGPTSDGVFPPESIDRLRGIGGWMAKNSDSIYGTAASPFPTLAWGHCTQKRLENGRTRLFFHVFDWPKDGTLVVNGLLNQAVGAHLLADPDRQSLKVVRAGEALRVTVPSMPPDPVDSVVVLEIAGRPDVTIAPTITAASDIFVDALDVTISSGRERVDLRYTLDGTEPAPNSPVARRPLRITATTTVRSQAFRDGRPVSPIATATFTKVTPRPAERPTSVEPGLQFDCVEGTFSKLPDFDAAVPARRGTVSTFDLGPRTRENQFAFRFRGFISVARDGVYRFFVRSDDGSRMWIGARLVVENDGLHSAHEESGVLALKAGLHPITVAMFEQSGGFELGVSYSGPDLPKRPIPASALFRLK